jgi:hypothetical protein
MREVIRRDGCVAVYDDHADGDVVIVEPTVVSFAPARGNARCACGAALEPSGWRCVAADDVELACNRCHRVHGHFRLGTRVHR